MTERDIRTRILLVADNLGKIEDELYDNNLSRDDLAAGVGDLVKSLEDIADLFVMKEYV